MNNQRDFALFIGIVSCATAVAASSHLWIPKLLQFIGTNTNLIQGLTDFIQIILWIAILLISIFKIWLGTQNSRTSNHSTNSTTKDENVALVKPTKNPDSTTQTQYNNYAEEINGLNQGDNGQVTNHFHNHN